MEAFALGTSRATPPPSNCISDLVSAIVLASLIASIAIVWRMGLNATTAFWIA